MEAITEAISEADAHLLFQALRAAGVSVAWSGNAAADDGACEIPGYGIVWVDVQPGVEPGWVVTGYTDDVDYPVDVDELTEELCDIVQWSNVDRAPAALTEDA